MNRSVMKRSVLLASVVAAVGCGISDQGDGPQARISGRAGSIEDRTASDAEGLELPAVGDQGGAIAELLTTSVPDDAPAAPEYSPKAQVSSLAGGSVIRSYKDSNAWFGENRDHATLLSLGLVVNVDYFIHPLLNLQNGIPAGTTVVLFPSNGTGSATAAARQNHPVAQANLDKFVRDGGVLIVDMGDNLTLGGYQAPGATGTPTLVLASGTAADCVDATLAPGARGPDGVLGTADDHPIVKGPDGIAGTADDLNNVNIDMVGLCSVAHGNLVDGITLPPDAKVLMTARFGGVEKPILAEYCLGSGVVIVDTITKEFAQQKGPAGPNGPTFFMRNLFDYALKGPGASCNAPPTAAAGADLVLECTGPDGAKATLDGSGSSDPDGDQLSFAWSAPGISFDDPASATPAAMFPIGATNVTLVVTDPNGASDSDAVSVTVQDTIAPEIKLDLLTTQLWPPDHTMRLVASGVTVQDTCDPAATVSISVTSNEPIDGPGDGSTDPDWLVTQNPDGTFDIFLRAERSGNGSGRVYTITVTTVDSWGNPSFATAEVKVAHDQHGAP